MNLFTNRKKLTDLENLWLPGHGIVRGFEVDMYTPLYLKWITNKDLLHSTKKELCSMLCGSLDGRGLWGENGHISMNGWDPLLFTCHYHSFVNWLCSNTKKKKVLKKRVLKQRSLGRNNLEQLWMVLPRVQRELRVNINQKSLG